MKKRLASLLEVLQPSAISLAGDPEISGIGYDSRTIREGDLFVAFSGLHSDGHDYVDEAIARGAVAIVHDKPIRDPHPGISYLLVADARLSMALLAAALHDYPSASLRIIGVTGTEGKSTTRVAYLPAASHGGREGRFLFDGDVGYRERPKTQPGAPDDARSHDSAEDARRDARFRL